MFELDINKIKEQSMQFVDTAYKAAMDIADKGKNQLDLASQQNRLAKAQRQLGALVYSLHKAEEKTSPWWINISRTLPKSKRQLRKSRPA